MNLGLLEQNLTANTSKRKFKKTEFFKPYKELHTVRVMPPLPDKNPDGFITYVLHWVNGTAIICESTLGYSDCAVCGVYNILMEDGNTDLADTIRPQQHWLFPIVERFDEEKGVQVWDITAAIVRDELVKMLKIDPQCFDKDMGRDFSFVYKKPAYSKFDWSDRKPISSDPAKQTSFLSQIPKLTVYKDKKVKQRTEIIALLTQVSELSDILDFS